MRALESISPECGWLLMRPQVLSTEILYSKSRRSVYADLKTGDKQKVTRIGAIWELHNFRNGWTNLGVFNWNNGHSSLMSLEQYSSYLHSLKGNWVFSGNLPWVHLAPGAGCKVGGIWFHIWKNFIIVRADGK